MTQKFGKILHYYHSEAKEGRDGHGWASYAAAATAAWPLSTWCHAAWSTTTWLRGKGRKDRKGEGGRRKREHVRVRQYWTNERNWTINRQNPTLQYKKKWHWQKSWFPGIFMVGWSSNPPLFNRLFCQCLFIFYCNVRFCRFMVPFCSLIKYSLDKTAEPSSGLPCNTDLTHIRGLPHKHMAK